MSEAEEDTTIECRKCGGCYEGCPECGGSGVQEAEEDTRERGQMYRAECTGCRTWFQNESGTGTYCFRCVENEVDRQRRAAFDADDALTVALEERDDYKQGVEAGAILLREAERERDEWKTQHGYAMEGQESWQFTAKQNLERAERAEAALAEALWALRNIRDEMSHGQMANHEYIEQQFALLEREHGRLP